MAAPNLPAPRTQLPPLQRRISPIQCIIIATLFLAILVGLALLITWLTMRPKRLIYSIEAASLQEYVLKKDDHLSAKFSYVIKSYNPDKHLSVKYHTMRVSTAHQNQSVAHTEISPFKQPPRNETRIDTQLVSHNVALSNYNAKGLRDENLKGESEWDVYITARVSYKVGIWRSRKRTLKAVCTPVMLNLTNTSNGFTTTYCQTHL